MKTNARYDVLIVGAGPAGAFLGYLLAAKGIKVCVIDKKPFPRYKACAGGITRRAGKILPFDFSPVIDDETYTVKLFSESRPVFDQTLSRPITWMVMRDRFDNFLVEQAVNNGAVFQDNTGFKSISGKPGNLTVTTTQGVYATQIIVGADGANSRVARALGLSLERGVMVAVEGEVYLDDSDLLSRFQGTTHYDFGVVPQGYGWIFPKKDHLSMGVGTFSGKMKAWKQCFDAYLTLKKIDSGIHVRTLKGHLIPCHPQKGDVLGKPQGLLVGDAAGITDPITGEGIYYALRGAEIASQVIIDSLVSGYDKMPKYSELMLSEFLHEMVCAGRLAFLLYRMPRFSKKVLQRFGNTLGDNMSQVIAGDQTYAQLYNKVFSLKKIISTIKNT